MTDVRQNMPQAVFKLLTQDLPKRYPAVRKIWLFGSRATGKHQQMSDIDLAFDAPELSNAAWLELTSRINHETMLKIDCVDLRDAAPELRSKIQQQGVVIYG
jgi:predicted nucleotidyltransferase